MKSMSKTMSFVVISLFLVSCSRITEQKASVTQPTLYPVKEKSRYGYMNESGQIVVPADFDYVWDFKDGMGRVRKNGKYGFVNDKGELSIPAAFAYADDFKDGFARVNTKDTTVLDRHYDGYDLNSDWTFIDRSGVVIGQSFAKAEYIRTGLAQVKDDPSYDAAWSYATMSGGQIAVEERNTEAIFSFNGHYTAPASDTETGKIGTINNREEWVIQPEFDGIEPFSEELAAAKKGNRFGYINEKGDWIYSRVVPVNEYYFLTSDFRPFANGLAIVKVATDSYAFIDKSGKQLFQRFRAAQPFNPEGYAIVTTEGGTGLIDRSGTFVIKPNLDIVSTQNGVVIYRDGSRYGAKEIKTSRDIVPPVYDNVEFSGNLLRVVNKGGTYGFINSKGDFAIDPRYDMAWQFKNSKAIVQQDEKYYYVDKNGRNIGSVPPEYQPYYYANSNALYASQENGKFGYSSPEKEGYAIPATYDFATDFEGQVARVNTGAMLNEETWAHEGGKWGLINSTGSQVSAPSYDVILPFADEVALVNSGGVATFTLCEGDCFESVYYTCKGGLWGLIDKKGNPLIETKYAYLIPFGKNFLAGNDGVFSIIGPDGVERHDMSLQIDLPADNDGTLISYADRNFIEARTNDLSGIITPSGEWIAPAMYDDVEFPVDATSTPYVDGLLLVRSGDLWGAADKNGTLVIPAEHEALRVFRSGLAAAKKDGLWGYIDKANQWVVTPVFHSVRDFQGEVAIVQPQPEGPEGVISTSGEILFKPTAGIEMDYNGFIDGLCIITGKVANESAGYPVSTYGVINDKGKTLFNQSALSDVRVYPGGLIYAIKNNKWAMANRDGAMLTGYNYDWIEPFHGQELIRCNIGGEIVYDEYGSGEEAYGGRWGFLDKTGDARIPMRYDELGAFNEGLAAAKTAEDLDEIGYFDLSGKQVRKPTQ